MDAMLDDLYMLLDHLNARIEEMVGERRDPGTFELALAKVDEKSREFFLELEDELETLRLLEKHT